MDLPARAPDTMSPVVKPVPVSLNEASKVEPLQSPGETNFPVLKKGKMAERALSIWARNNQHQGLPLTDTIIREKALFFASTVNHPEEALSSRWLERFKQKNGLTGPKLRKGSFGVVDDLESDGNGDSNIGLKTQR